MNHLAVHIGQADISSLVRMDQPLVIDSQEVQDGRIEIMNVDRIASDVVGEVVGFTMHMPLFDPATCEEHAEAARVMVAAIVLLGEPTLTVDGPAELSTPDHQRVIE